MHSHRTALSFIDWCSQEFSPDSEDRFSSHAPFHFDLSILDLFVSIKHGSTVVLIGEELGKQPMRLAPTIAERRISIWYSTPSILRLLTDFGQLDKQDLTRLRLILFAGEVFPMKHLSALHRILPNRRVLQSLWADRDQCLHVLRGGRRSAQDTPAPPPHRSCLLG